MHARHPCTHLTLILALAALAAGALAAQAPRGGDPWAGVEVDRARLDAIEPVVLEAIEDRKLPGAVVLVGHGDRVLYHTAIGNRAVDPSVEPMTLDTIFDAASLTKPVATATAVMMLVEDGKIRLTDRVADYIPASSATASATSPSATCSRTCRGCAPTWTGRSRGSGTTAIELAVEEMPRAAPGQRFIYSDIGYFLLAHIVQEVAGQPLDRVREGAHLRAARDARHDVPAAAGALPADRADRAVHAVRLPVRGRGHADAARHGARPDRAADGGRGGPRRHVHDVERPGDLRADAARRRPARRPALPLALSVAKLVAPGTPDAEPNVRALGWDMDSTYSANRGELLPLGSFGHTGFTGTSIWIDPTTGMS
jgi:CubicO group peptidase (beta-lactamase class C family)